MTRYLSIFLPFIFVGIFALAACGGGGSQGDSDFSNKNLSLTVSGSKSFNPNIIHGQIDYYLMTVSADDLAAPFIERFSGEAASGKMVGIPAGTGRTILVEAVNPNGLVIRRGKAEGVTIAPGMMSHVEIVMHTVPIFTNLANKSAVAVGRLAFHLFGEPGSKLEVMEVTGDETAPIVDATRGELMVDTSNAEGLFRHQPGDEYDVGPRTFRVWDADSGEASDITLLFYEPTTRPGIAVTAGGAVRRLGDELVLTNAGQFYFRDVEIGAESLSESAFLDVVDLMY